VCRHGAFEVLKISTLPQRQPVQCRLQRIGMGENINEVFDFVPFLGACSPSAEHQVLCCNPRQRHGIYASPPGASKWRREDGKICHPLLTIFFYLGFIFEG